MIPPPHGGRLVTGQLSPRDAERFHEELRDLPKLWPEPEQLLDVEQIGIGAYSPLDGFMDRDTLDKVLLTSRLPNTLPWTIPILLTPPGSRNRRTIAAVRPGDELALLDAENRPVARLRLREIYPLERTRIAREVYRTTDAHHPNVAALHRTGDMVLAGPIDLVARSESDVSRFELTPAETRGMFHHRRWSSVAAFQTRNVPHRAHEHLQRMTLDRDEIDGLFIHPVVGWPKPGDYRPAAVMAAYEALIANYLPAERVALASLSIGMRFAGPRAALFLGIVRKNYGCSHYIVGRDQAGINGYFDPYESQRVFDELPIGVVPLRFPELFICRRCDGIVSLRSCPHDVRERVTISQTRVREALAHGGSPPPDLLRPEVVAALRGIDRLLVDTDMGPPEDSDVDAARRDARRPAQSRDIETPTDDPAAVHSGLPSSLPHPA